MTPVPSGIKNTNWYYLPSCAPMLLAGHIAFSLSRSMHGDAVGLYYEELRISLFSTTANALQRLP